MPLSPSLAGQLGASVWKHNPVLGLGLAFGTGAGVYAGVHTLATGGSASEAGDSSLKYALGGSIGMFGILSTTPVWSRAGGFVAGRTIRNAPGAITSYAKGIGSEFAAARATGGIGAGISRVAERKGLMTGLGAAVGAAIGANIDKEHPGKGAAIGAGVGAGAGLAISTGLRASRLWKNIGPIGRTGLVASLSTLAFAGAAYANRPKYGSMDRAAPEDYGLSRRMNAMSATGDIVLGLHNSR